MTSKAPSSARTGGPLWCSTCGSKLVGGDCVECDRPRATARGLKPKAVPARAYAEPPEALRVVEPAVDIRRSSAEWLTQPKDDAPSTRRAHPTQVRTALAEAEEKARARSVTQDAKAQVARPVSRPRGGRPNEAKRTTAPRVRAVTPVPPPPPEATGSAPSPAASPVRDGPGLERAEPIVHPAAPTGGRSAVAAPIFEPVTPEGVRRPAHGKHGALGVDDARVRLWAVAAFVALVAGALFVALR